ncbi:TadE/TadG family type IV pilus assembly protein [Ruegeria lacuscaerulensis]|uniref:TadE/TadG family type IV pilus assembly protein n=1 Tax=Ruegeria lacuscaerulensis TaxID=55218 RepID=UPI00147EEC5C|nr:hypothetical protein [Ruegeria lacuscaerulensis]
MRIFSKIGSFFGSKARNESGMLTVEALLVFPMLVWTITGTFTFFEGFRQSAANVKAAYTVGDLISRESHIISDTYLQSMYILMARMVNNGTELNLRVSVVVFDDGDDPDSDADDTYAVEWSSECGYGDIWTNDNIENMRDSLPPMSDQDPLIIVESTNKFAPTFGSGWVDDDHSFNSFVFTSPRFDGQVVSNASATFCSVSTPTVSTS